MKRTVFFAALLVTTQANASLLDGKTVGFEKYYPSLADLYYTAPTTTVGAGVEFSTGAGGENLDIADTSITVSFNSLGSYYFGWFPSAPFNGFRIFDVNNTIDAFTSVTIEELGPIFVRFDGTPILNLPDVTFDSNNIYVNWQGMYFDTSKVVRLNINGSNNVPEPATLALLGLGLAGLSTVRRRKDVTS